MWCKINFFGSACPYVQERMQMLDYAAGQTMGCLSLSTNRLRWGAKSPSKLDASYNTWELGTHQSGTQTSQCLFLTTFEASGISHQQGLDKKGLGFPCRMTTRPTHACVTHMLGSYNLSEATFSEGRDSSWCCRSCMQLPISSCRGSSQHLT